MFLKTKLFFVFLFTFFSQIIYSQNKSELDQGYLDSYKTIDINEDHEIILVEENVIEEEIPQIEKWPELISFSEAHYPPTFYRKGIEGTVLLSLTISDSGTVDSVSVLKGLTPVLDSNASSAALKLKFSPAIAGGQPVPAILQYEYRFSLDEIANRIEKYTNFSGQLLEKGTRKPINDAMVIISFIDTVSDTTIPVPFSKYIEYIGSFEGQYLEEKNLVTTTDSTGSFKFKSIPICSILVSNPVPEYENIEEKEYLTRDQELIVKYIRKRVSYSDYEIVVYGKSEEKEVSRRQLSLNEVKAIPGFGGDAVKVLQALPGVARPTFTSGELIIRGSGREDTKCFLDGIEIPLLFHFHGLKSTYNSDLLSSVDLYPGGFNSSFGGTVGGAIEIIGRKAKTDHWHGNADINALDASLLAEGPISDKISLAATVRHSYVDKIIENVTKDLSITVLPSYWDIITRFDYMVWNLFCVMIRENDFLDGLVIVSHGAREKHQARQHQRLQKAHSGILTNGIFSEKIRQIISNLLVM